MATYFRPSDAKEKDKEKWERLKALDESDGKKYHELAEGYTSEDNKPEWLNKQYIRILQTMKTYFQMNKYQYDCALYKYEQFETPYVMTPYGRTSIEELLLSIALSVQQKVDYFVFLSAIRDYQCNKLKVLWLIKNLFN